MDDLGGMMAAQPTSLLRAPGDDAHRVSFFELFFDLVYVFAVTQLSHGCSCTSTCAGWRRR